MKNPYLELYKKENGFRVYIVDGAYIRKNLNDQFTNFGQHYRFPKMIPTKEIWIDKDYGNPNEYKYFIAHSIKEWELMRKGKDYDTAIAEADELEHGLRNKDEDNQYKIKQLDEIDGLSIWLVDGKKIRDDCFIDFTEGGHDLVYDWIPENEVWIDNSVSAKERAYIIAHEVKERQKMEKGEKYKQAHNEASFFERHLRHKLPNIGRINAKKSRHHTKKSNIMRDRSEATLSNIK